MVINANEYLKALKDAFEQEAQKCFDSLSAEIQEKLYRLKDLNQTYDDLDIFTQKDIDFIHKANFFNLFFYNNESLSKQSGLKPRLLRRKVFGAGYKSPLQKRPPASCLR